MKLADFWRRNERIVIRGYQDSRRGFVVKYINVCVVVRFSPRLLQDRCARQPK
jgi:hypothetical protein